MGLNVNVARHLLQQKLQANKNDKPENVVGEEIIGGKIETKPQEPNPEDIITDNIENTYTYFYIYDGITSRLGDFYAETLAKIKDNTLFSSKNFFSGIYNKIMNNTVKDAQEKAKNGEKLNFDELAQSVKDQIIKVLEDCDYSAWRYFAQ